MLSMMLFSAFALNAMDGNNFEGGRDLEAGTAMSDFSNHHIQMLPAHYPSLTPEITPHALLLEHQYQDHSPSASPTTLLNVYVPQAVDNNAENRYYIHGNRLLHYVRIPFLHNETKMYGAGLAVFALGAIIGLKASPWLNGCNQ